MEKNKIFKFIDNNIMDTQEVMKFLCINRNQLSTLIEKGDLVSIRKGIYLKTDVEKCKAKQEKSKYKFYKTLNENFL